MLAMGIGLLIGLLSAWISTLFPAPWYPIWIVRLILTELFWIPFGICVLLSIVFFVLQSEPILGLSYLILAILFARPFLFGLLDAVEIIHSASFFYPNKEARLSAKHQSLKVRQTTVAYTPNRYLEIFSPIEKDAIVGAILCIHGGAWRGGSRLDFAYTHRKWAAKGFLVCAPQYSLSSESCFPYPIDELKLAWEYMVGIVPPDIPLYLLGRSAGGQLAGILASKLKKQVSGLVLMYTPSDLYWGYQFPGNPLVLDSREVLQNYLGGDLQKMPDAYQAASINYQITADFPPTLMVHGLQDELVAFGHNIRLIEALSKHNIPYLCVAIPYATHGFDYFYHSVGARLTEQYIFSFLEKYKSRHHA